MAAVPSIDAHISRARLPSTLFIMPTQELAWVEGARSTTTLHVLDPETLEHRRDVVVAGYRATAAVADKVIWLCLSNPTWMLAVDADGTVLGLVEDVYTLTMPCAIDHSLVYTHNGDSDEIMIVTATADGLSEPRVLTQFQGRPFVKWGSRRVAVMAAQGPDAIVDIDTGAQEALTVLDHGDMYTTLADGVLIGCNGYRPPWTLTVLESPAPDVVDERPIGTFTQLAGSSVGIVHVKLSFHSPLLLWPRLYLPAIVDGTVTQQLMLVVDLRAPLIFNEIGQYVVSWSPRTHYLYDPDTQERVRAVLMALVGVDSLPPILQMRLLRFVGRPHPR